MDEIQLMNIVGDFPLYRAMLRETVKFHTAASESPMQQELTQEEAILNMVDGQPSSTVRS